ncbi:peptide-methionine (S)-S-oxide reductase MsrA [Celerinatantimonas diazotrophica]|uniref:Peptide methionine sulfoxide reductase MsrA n=1 Tax=Celerinatantimonas diazotrophica TaxID=412034 RepID=A0A4R1J842_9GAMM|nr:peptide-methionine (S)-S-oxide reductase MsrA [Celerinatantimonas diazotrophica]TCK46540.1 peptide-methionine (S)-S-oxide reductase [Celerinatantimonas diazotrophica]CAG9296590.1 Peptide methionine sulfoxide reductase MsrA [Celerinatantimonas diazotrophica]
MVDKTVMVKSAEALPGREEQMPVSGEHYVHHTSYLRPFDKSMEVTYFAMGCFWGAERLLWEQPGVVTTAVGYAGGYTPNPTYEEVCTGQTGHAEAVLVVFDPVRTSYERLLKVFFESHDPTQGMKQGGDIGTQYRSMLLTTNPYQYRIAERALENYQQALAQSGKEAITTEIHPAEEFYYAEEYHQQYLAKNPNGYCGIAGTGVCMPPMVQS